MIWGVPLFLETPKMEVLDPEDGCFFREPHVFFGGGALEFHVSELEPENDGSVQMKHSQVP